MAKKKTPFTLVYGNLPNIIVDGLNDSRPVGYQVKISCKCLMKKITIVRYNFALSWTIDLSDTRLKIAHKKLSDKIGIENQQYCQKYVITYSKTTEISPVELRQCSIGPSIIY